MCMYKVPRKYFVILVLLITGCHSVNDKPLPVGPTLFEVLDSSKTGLDFVNQLHPTPEFNLFKYMYFYNGGGVGTGDFNNDGLIDLFFTANQGDNKLYLNKGGLKFMDATTTAHIPQDSGWSTGVHAAPVAMSNSSRWPCNFTIARVTPVCCARRRFPIR